MCAFSHACIHLCVCTCIYACVHVCQRVCVRMHACVCAYVCAFKCVSACMDARSRARVSMCGLEFVYACMYAFTFYLGRLDLLGCVSTHGWTCNMIHKLWNRCVWVVFESIFACITHAHAAAKAGRPQRGLVGGEHLETATNSA